ncbi:hypothetical protein H0X10_02850 [Candidatus Saccharibacteria bacterium]|nr:hypothetical protein [Candidatus Saccharibacteria bacterium]
MKSYLFNLAQTVLTTEDGGIPRVDLSQASIGSILRLVFGLAGAVSVLIITIAAFQYVTSQGEPQSTAKAKNTIMYALIGLAICITAFSIVTFILVRI